jgi:hypothetical protein
MTAYIKAGALGAGAVHRRSRQHTHTHSVEKTETLLPLLWESNLSSPAHDIFIDFAVLIVFVGGIKDSIACAGSSTNYQLYMDLFASGEFISLTLRLSGLIAPSDTSVTICIHYKHFPFVTVHSKQRMVVLISHALCVINTEYFLQCHVRILSYVFVVKSAIPSFPSSRKLLLLNQLKPKMCIYWYVL